MCQSHVIHCFRFASRARSSGQVNPFETNHNSTKKWLTSVHVLRCDVAGKLASAAQCAAWNPILCPQHALTWRVLTASPRHSGMKTSTLMQFKPTAGWCKWKDIARITSTTVFIKYVLQKSSRVFRGRSSKIWSWTSDNHMTIVTIIIIIVIIIIVT